MDDEDGYFFPLSKKEKKICMKIRLIRGIMYVFAAVKKKFIKISLI